jgi:hypothetical protein
MQEGITHRQQILLQERDGGENRRLAFKSTNPRFLITQAYCVLLIACEISPGSLIRLALAEVHLTRMALALLRSGLRATGTLAAATNVASR